RNGGKTFAQPGLHPQDDDPTWLDATTPVIAGDTLYVGFLTAKHGWQIAVFEQAAPLTRGVSVLDRLGVERQLARVTQGLPLQDEAVERTLREQVLRLGSPSTAASGD
ncbi:MAG: hypothetical protein VXX30_04070, partial [Planctomycetota bacterium]|nr:hypothetical protein [Planctomycetota bacterium]